MRMPVINLRFNLHPGLGVEVVKNVQHASSASPSLVLAGFKVQTKFRRMEQLKNQYHIVHTTPHWPVRRLLVGVVRLGTSTGTDRRCRLQRLASSYHI